MEIIIADNSGFCIGVKNAVNKTMKVINDNKNTNINSYGPIIHNPQFIKKIEDMGVKVIDSLEEINEGIIISRTHGITNDVLKKAENKKIKVIDIVCPFVKKIHELAKEYSKKGYKIIIFGDKFHPEVQAFFSDISNISDPLVINSTEEVPKSRIDKALLISQTTQEEEDFIKISEALKNMVKDLVIKDTICQATKLRQESAKKLAKNVDLMIIVGGKNSGNTCRLFKICKNIVKSVHIETRYELDDKLFEGVKKVGITAGASTPDFIIESILEYLKGMKNSKNSNKSFIDLIESYKEKINDEINLFLKTILHDKNGFEKEFYCNLHEYITNGGKRLRPISLIMAYKAISGKIDKEIIQASISVELYHACTLIHDDIMDEDVLRRGKDTVFESMRKYYLKNHAEENFEGVLYKNKSSRFAISQGMIGGNIIDAISEMPIIDSAFPDKQKIEALRKFSECKEKINIGQSKDIFSELDQNISEGTYWEMIKGKTGQLFVSSIQIGAILAGADQKQIDALTNYAWNAGATFQLQDDIMDITNNNKKGHEMGSDIKKGKRTMLIIKALEKSNDKQKSIIKKTLGNCNANEKEILEVIKIIKETGSLEYAQKLAKGRIKKGKEYLDRADLKKEGKEFFIDFADYMMKRDI